jgi:hypothetical protein
MDWATFWAIFSQSHLVTLFYFYCSCRRFFCQREKLQNRFFSRRGFTRTRLNRRNCSNGRHGRGVPPSPSDRICALEKSGLEVYLEKIIRVSHHVERQQATKVGVDPNCGSVHRYDMKIVFCVNAPKRKKKS